MTMVAEGDGAARGVESVLELADARWDEGDRSGARQVLRDGLAATGPDVRLLLKLAAVEWRDGFEDESRALLAEASALDPDDPGVIAARVDRLRGERRYREAMALWDGLPEAARRADGVRTAFGELYADMGWHAVATAAFGPGRGLDLAARSVWLRSWLRSGGPVAALRRRVLRRDNESRTNWLRWSRSSDGLDGLAGVSADALAVMCVELDEYLLRWSARTDWSWSVRTAVRQGAWWVAAVAALLVLIVDRPLAGPGPLLLGRLVFGGTVVVVAVSIASLGASALSRLRSSGARLVVGVLGWLAVAGGGGWLLFRTPPVSPWSPGTVGLVAVLSAVLAAMSLAANGLTRYLTYRGVARIKEDRPRAAIVDNLLEVLAGMSKERNRNDLAERSWWVWALEDAAAMMERRLCRVYPFRDPTTDAWVVERAAGAATAVRELKRLIGASSAEGWTQLTAALRHELTALVAGDFGALKWAPPPSRRARWAERGRLAARTVLGAALPIGGVLALQPLLRLDSGVYGWAKVVSLVWALLYVLLTLDPTARDKLDAVRGVAESMSKGKP
ncbi:hypothetical protein F0L68_40540 [Solihabitans fulvus]|uniref:Tetratricopeptide repeat protein n=1 Tax=Solihabitans fulvus TaxID=1892852 RepID=A0A5B2W7G7_9PSEU|nr:hypothetical protein [Solihabitans fulvus]KAA2246758.1 hypothetical protein F0L68_40540 [Solihabitans fulvus]